MFYKDKKALDGGNYALEALIKRGPDLFSLGSKEHTRCQKNESLSG